VSISPAFGQADLTNCEREQIHLAGSVQPHGLLLVLREPGLRIVQASTSAATWLQRPLDQLLMAPVQDLGGNIDACLRALLNQAELQAEFAAPQPLRCHVDAVKADGLGLAFEGALHRVGHDTVVVELEALPHPAGAPHHYARLMTQISAAVQGVSEAASVSALADLAVQVVREVTGYDRVMVYEFDPDGHGKIIAEARDASLDSLLGHRYPATDIPQRARQLYLRNRVRLLVDVNNTPSPLVPQLLPGSAGHDADFADDAGGELDMSLCGLRSMSPLHLQYLRNMGVGATLVVSIVREGRLWGLIACHHYAPRHVGHGQRAACELLGEVMATRIAAIENHARAHVAMQVRRLEQRLVEATSAEGDWRLALFRNPASLLQPLHASGAVLCHDGEWLTCGEVPSTQELRSLLAWVHLQVNQQATQRANQRAHPQVSKQAPAADKNAMPGLFSTACLTRENAELASLSASASGVLAIRLSPHRADYLMWLRREQLQSVTWAGNPAKPVVNNNPLELSPRRSFAAWSEIVRGTSLPWAGAELALAQAFGHVLIDIIVQVNAVRLLITESQLVQVRSQVAESAEAVVVADTARLAFYANDAFLQLAGCPRDQCTSLSDLVSLFSDTQAAHLMLGQVQAEQRAWRGEMSLRRPHDSPLPVNLRAEPVPARDGSLLGYIFLFDDLTASKQAVLARDRLDASLTRTGLAGTTLNARATHDGPDTNDVHMALGAIVANASLAAMDISEGGTAPSVAPQLQEVQTATARATALFNSIRAWRDTTDPPLG
jgi:two-component system, chemotaxis family, sensor kinase Cph1